MKNRCMVCGKEINEHHTCLVSITGKGSICGQCEHVKWTVYRLNKEDALGTGLHVLAIQDLYNELGDIEHSDIGDSFIITKELMLASKFLDLPEFEGF